MLSFILTKDFNKLGGRPVLKSEKRESQKFKKRYGPRRHKMLGINKWIRKRKGLQGEKDVQPEVSTKE